MTKKQALKPRFKDHLYHCSHCKLMVPTVDDLYFVEEGQARGFCSEKCIEAYYSPLIDQLDKMEKDLRSAMKLEDEDCLAYVGRPKDMEAVIRRPTEVWRQENILKEEIYAFMTTIRDSSNEPYWVILLCTVFDHRPSFILLATTTKSVKFKSEFEVGQKVEDLRPFYEVYDHVDKTSTDIDAEMMESLERKKASYLADLLERRSPHDIPIEDFMMYEKFFTPSMESPDEVYQFQDEEGDTIYTYIKAHAEGPVSFFYFILCMPIGSSAEDAGSETVVPILAFPTLDADVHRAYKHGTLISGVLKN